MASTGYQVRLELLGRFRVTVGERQVTEADWPTRRAQELVALLALDPVRRVVRDQVVEALWPHLTAAAGAANLRKAAHHARRTLGDADAIVLRGGTVELFPGLVVSVDVDDFLTAAGEALRSHDPDRCAATAAMCPGELLPGFPYETWAQEPRRRVHDRLLELLRRAGSWQRVLEVEPTDEAACRHVMRTALREGRRHVAIRAYEQLRLAMLRELRSRPSPDTRALYDECTASFRPGRTAFVGRNDEMAAAMAELDRIARESAGAVVVRGATGIGKSSFCLELLERARESGWRTVSVTATAAAEPYAPIGAAVEHLLASGREPLEALPERTRSVLAGLTPLAGPAPGSGAALTRHQVIAALRRALAAPGDDRPTLLFVDDAHLADEATADVLHQLVASGGGAPIAVAAAFRSEWIQTSLPRGLREIARGDRTLKLSLGPLPDEDIRQLVSSIVPGAAGSDEIGRLATAADGSPFFALELARALAAGAHDALPSLREAIAERFATLDGDTLDAVAMLAVAEGDLTIAGVLALTALGEDRAFALLDAALEAGVLVVSGTRYRFRHDLIRQALTDGLPPHRRIALHRDAAQRLAAAGGPPAAVAHHWLAGRRPAEALPWLLAAARRAVALGAYADALGEVKRLLSHAPDHHEGLVAQAEILDALGDPRAPDAYAEAASAVGDPDAQDLHARRALAQLKASDPRSALRTLEGVTPRGAAGRLAEALTLSAAAAIGCYADAETAATKADEAHRLAVEIGDPGAILDATWAHALAAHAKGELPARLREYVRATRDLPELATRVFDGQLCVTERMLYGGLPNDEVRAFADSLAEESRRVGASRGEAFALTLRGETEVLAGRLDEADRDFAEGARLHGLIGAVAGEALSLLGRARVAISRSQARQALPFLVDALLMARESEVGHHTLDRIYGSMVEAAPDPPSGVEVIREAEAAIQGPAETCPTCRIAFVVPAAIAAARAGDLERARRYERDCERAIDIVALPPAWHAAVAEVRGWVGRAEARDDAAREHFGVAADGFRAWGQPLDARRCAELAAR